MNVYDFDETIFQPDSSFAFILYCVKRCPGALLRTAPGTIRAAVRYRAGRIPTKTLKEQLFSFLRYVPDPEGLVQDFWDKHFSQVERWYLNQRKADDLIITASPEFLVGEAARRLGVSVLGTRMDIRSGRIEGENCHDSEKVNRFRALYGDTQIAEFYSDSLSDTPMARLARQAFLVHKGTLRSWPDSNHTM